MSHEANNGTEDSLARAGENKSGITPHIGRPTSYTPQLADSICDRVSEGESLRKVCEDDEMPSRSTVYLWLGQNQAFSDRYARSVEDRAEKMAEEILSIADDDEGDYGFKESKDGDGEGAKPCILPDNIQRARLRVDSRKWIASKLFPKKYGDFQRNETDLKVKGQIIVQSSPVDEGL